MDMIQVWAGAGAGVGVSCEMMGCGDTVTSDQGPDQRPGTLSAASVDRRLSSSQIHRIPSEQEEDLVRV